MEAEIKEKISDLLNALKKKGKKNLARCIEENWQKKAREYSKELNSWRARGLMEKELRSAFAKELERLEVAEPLREKILKSLEERRVLQTAPHLGATESPRMLAINWLGSLGVPDDEFYVVGMYSGIPFSNNSRPGRINRKTDSINLFPSNLQDALVYRSVIPEKLAEAVHQLPHHLKKFFPRAKIGHSYTAWALQACQNIEGKVLEKDNLICLDINEVITGYLSRVLEKTGHVLNKIFFDQATRAEFTKAFPDEIIFYSPASDGKTEWVENLKMKEISFSSPPALIKELKDNRLCPGLLLGFLVLAFLNEFKCLGSFRQVEYLPDYQKKLGQLKCLKDFDVDKVPTANLTTGEFKDGPYPVDIILGQEWIPDPNMLFGELIINIKYKLLDENKK